MRDKNILKSYRRECLMAHRVVPSKKRYTRKVKHKKRQIY